MLWRWGQPVDFITVASADGAEKLVTKLGTHGIRAKVRRNQGHLGGHDLQLHRVIVRASDLPRATVLLQSGALQCNDLPLMTTLPPFPPGQPAQRGNPDAIRLLCGDCGYEMTSMSRAAACPECGARGPRAETPVSPPRPNAAFWMLMLIIAALCSLPLFIILSMLL